jgi:hypothetical protein
MAPYRVMMVGGDTYALDIADRTSLDARCWPAPNRLHQVAGPTLVDGAKGD